MAHEIRASAAPNKTLTARLYQGNAAVGSVITMVESAQPGWYTASVPAGTPAGLYQVLLLEAGTLLDAVPLQWDGVSVEEVVIPGPPADVGICRVYAYLEGVNNDKRLTNARIEFRLVAPDDTRAIASERLIGERLTTLKVDGLGRLQGEDGQPWADFQRNDMLTPAGSSYEVTSSALGISRKSITLNTPIANLRDLLIA